MTLQESSRQTTTPSPTRHALRTIGLTDKEIHYMELIAQKNEMELGKFSHDALVSHLLALVDNPHYFGEALCEEVKENVKDPNASGDLAVNFYFTQAQIDTLLRLAQITHQSVDEFLTSVIQNCIERDIQNNTLVWNSNDMLAVWNGKPEDSKYSPGQAIYRANLSFTPSQNEIIHRLASINLLGIEEYLTVKTTSIIQGHVDALINNCSLSEKEGEVIKKVWRGED